MSAMIELVGVNKSFGKQQVLTDICLTAAKGELLCLLGASGAGKTTLIRMITGGLKADAGNITVAGQIMPSMAAIGSIGYMPQSDGVYADVSGLDNLLFFGRMFGMKGRKLKNRCNALLEQLALQQDRNKMVAHYSGGMKKRLSLAIALLHDPDILVLDEPTVGIDPVLRHAIWERFFDLCAEGKTIIVATHVMDEAEKCYRAALLANGRVIYQDRVAVLKRQTFGGSLEELFFTNRKEDLEK